MTNRTESLGDDPFPASPETAAGSPGARGSSTETTASSAAAAGERSARRSSGTGLRRALRRGRAWVRRRRQLNRVWRAGIGVLGTVIVAVGIVAIPYPGPGWLIVFTGLGILATEFAWAGRLLHRLRGYYDQWVAWLGRRHLVVQLLAAGLTAVVVVATVWLLGALYLAAQLVGLEQWTWLRSPIP